jgi:hypothetical protein
MSRLLAKARDATIKALEDARQADNVTALLLCQMQIADWDGLINDCKTAGAKGFGSIYHPSKALPRKQGLC